MEGWWSVEIVHSVYICPTKHPLVVYVAVLIAKDGRSIGAICTAAPQIVLGRLKVPCYVCSSMGSGSLHSNNRISTGASWSCALAWVARAYVRIWASYARCGQSIATLCLCDNEIEIQLWYIIIIDFNKSQRERGCYPSFSPGKYCLSLM